MGGYHQPLPLPPCASRAKGSRHRYSSPSGEPRGWTGDSRDARAARHASLRPPLQVGWPPLGQLPLGWGLPAALAATLCGACFSYHVVERYASRGWRPRREWRALAAMGGLLAAGIGVLLLLWLDAWRHAGATRLLINSPARDDPPPGCANAQSYAALRSIYLASYRSGDGSFPYGRSAARRDGCACRLCDGAVPTHAPPRLSNRTSAPLCRALDAPALFASREWRGGR